jgi:hypothetical protein
MVAMVPVTAEAACTCTGELTVAPLAGAQMWTPGEDGALQVPPATTVALTAFSHFWPAVLVAVTAKRWLPAARLMEVLSVLLEEAVYFATPSTHNCMRALVPVTVEAASTCTGELTAAPLAGEQM